MKRMESKLHALFVFLFAGMLLSGQEGRGQYLGVTCGWQYSSQLTGPLTFPNQANISLYNPQAANPNATWDDWAEQLDHAGVDFVCPNLTGSQPHNSAGPDKMAPLLTALMNRGLTNRIKFAIFDDNAASWVAQWNQANGRGFGYAQKFDMADTNNWKYIYDYNYKIFYQTIPDANRFKINGRPLIIIWTGNAGAFLTNMQGNASRAMTYVRQNCQADFGFNPYIVLSQDFFSNDTTCNNNAIADGSESWFTAGPSGPSFTLTSKFGVKVGVAVSEFQHSGQSGFLDPNHGVRFETGLSNTVEAGGLLTLCEGFTDYEEDAAMWRVRNIDTTGASLGYIQTYYDYPNQRLNILRKHSNWPFPPELKFEAEACDTFGGAAGGNGLINFYRNGNIAIEPTSDTSGTYDVSWIQPGEWLEWQEVPIQGGKVHFQVRVASATNNCQLHFMVDGTNYPPLMVPNTGGAQTWTTIDSGPYPFAKGGRHTVRLVCDTGGFSVNYWRYHTEIPIGVNVNLKATANNEWVSVASGSSSLNANAASPGASEVFTIVDASSGYGYGYVALRALTNGLFVTAYTNGASSLIADASSVGASQMFQWTDDGDGTIVLRALANSRLVSATNTPASFPLTINRIRLAGAQEIFAVMPVSTNSLSFVAQPNATSVEVPITAGALGELQVLALDSSNAPVAGATITIGVASGTGIITGNSAITDGAGIAHFTNLEIDKVGAKTLVASSSAFSSSVSSSFNITAGVPTTLTVETQPDGSGSALAAQNIAAGSSISVYAVYRDSAGNFATNVPAAWSLQSITGGVVNSDLISEPDARSVVFTGHVVGSARIQAAAAFTGQSGVQTVTGGPAAHLTVIQQPSATAKVGLPFAQQPKVSETDAFGNLAASPLTVTETGGAGAVNRNPSGITVAPINGVVSFSGLYLTNLGINSLTFSGGSATTQSSDIAMSIGNVEQLLWTTQPGNATNGFPFGISPVVQTADAGGNVTTLGLPSDKYIAVSIFSGTGTLLGTTTTNIGTSGGNGSVSFTNLGISSPGTFQLIAQDLGTTINPTNISAATNCQLWLDAADSSTLTLAGSTVSLWKDKSGRTNNASGVASFVTNTLLSSSSPGGARAVHFNGSQQLAMKLNSLSNSPYTILVMEVGASKSSGSSYFIGNNGGFNTDLTLGIGYQTATQFRWQQYADDLNYSGVFTNVVPRQWTMNLSVTPVKSLYLNSTLVGTAGSGFLTGTNLVNGTVGYNSYLGDIAEIIVYNTSLNINDQNNLQDYLMNKWLTGLNSATTDPFSVVSPVYYPSFGGFTPGYAGGTLSSMTFFGINGPTNGLYRVVTSTNIYIPVAAWTPVLTNAFDSSGGFSFTVPVTQSVSGAFYRVVWP